MPCEGISPIRGVLVNVSVYQRFKFGFSRYGSRVTVRSHLKKQTKLALKTCYLAARGELPLLKGGRKSR